MEQSIQLGFLIGIYFLASAVVALTLVYFSRPRPRNMATQNKMEPLPEMQGPLAENKPGSGKNFPRLKIIPFFQKSKVVNPPPKQLVQEEQATNRPDGSEKVAAEKPQSPSETGVGQEEINSGNNPSQGVSSPNKPDSPPDDLPVPQKSVEKEIAPVITITNAPKAQVVFPPSINSAQKMQNSETPQNTEPEEIKPETETIPVVPPPSINSAQKIENLETPKNTEPEEFKPKAETIPVVPAVKIVNEKEGKSEMNDKPKPENSNTDFSELFTEDTEETEAGRLAKELNEIDTKDILEESRDLINQFKRKKN